MSESGLRVRLQQDAAIPLAASFEVARGELLALVGPSGSGKSTILRAIAGLYGPRSGCVNVDGAAWLDRSRGVDLPPRKRRVGYVFQNYALFPHLTALANVTAAMSDQRRGERTGLARRLLERVHLAGLEHRRPAELSGGQQQRVAVARALASDPRVLLLDEPFAAVDRVTREKLQRELARLRQDLQLPIVFVTHDLDEAVRLADRIGVVHRGSLLQVADPETIMYRPASPLVARLVDIRNVFSGHVAHHEEDRDATVLMWHDLPIEVPRQRQLAAGSRVAWCIPADCVVLHRRDRPSRGERENPVHGRVSEAIRLGEMTHVRIEVTAGTSTIELTVPTHVARRNKVAQGEPIGVSLRRDAIHLMDPDADPDADPGADPGAGNPNARPRDRAPTASHEPGRRATHTTTRGRPEP